MKNLLVLNILIAIGLIFLGFGCATEPKKNRITTPYLFEAKKGNNHVYLFGTFHAGIPLTELPVDVLKYLNNSKVFVMESELDRPSLQNYYDSLFEIVKKRESEEALSNRLSAPEYNRLIALSGVCKELTYINKLSYTGAYSLLFLCLGRSKEIDHFNKLAKLFGTTPSMDLDLASAAKNKGKLIITLDSKNVMQKSLSCLYGDVEKSLSQMKILLGSTQDEIEAFYHQRLADTESSIEAYRTSNTAFLMKFFDTSNESQSTGFNTNCLIEERNKHWLPKILSHSQTYSSIFVAVGAGHLFASNSSLFKLLKAQGFAIKRIAIKKATHDN